MLQSARKPTFYGWSVVTAATVMAIFGWGIGFYGPPVFLSVVSQANGWSLALVSTAVTAHYLIGAVVGANLPGLHRRFGIPAVTMAGACSLALGVAGWATATAPWQLFIAAALSGAGWGTMSAAAVNAVIAPWFDRARPAALSTAYNGASIGGIIFSPLWVFAIGALGFPAAAAVIGIAVALTMGVLAKTVFAQSPETMGLRPDGDTPATVRASITSPAAVPLPGKLLWRDLRFRTLSAGMALGLFAQIGLTSHLFSLLTPALGAQRAGWAMALVTALAIAGRTLLGWFMPIGADRRLLACASYAAQLAGSIAFLAAQGTNIPLLLLGIVLFGVGFGNATSLPPLIAQVEFVKADVTRAVALIVGIGQGFYAFAPATFGLIREFSPLLAGTPSGAAPYVFVAAALVQGLAILAFFLGRR